MSFWEAGAWSLGVGLLALIYYVALDHIMWLRRRKNSGGRRS